MAVTPETLELYLKQYGWSFERTAEGDLRVVFRGDVSFYRILVRLTESWVYFSISPYVLTPRDPECEHKLHKHLLRQNHEMNMAKYTVDRDGDVSLTVELPTADLDYDEFADALGALVYYADDNYARTFILGHVPQAHALFEDRDLEWEAK